MGQWNLVSEAGMHGKMGHGCAVKAGGSYPKNDKQQLGSSVSMKTLGTSGVPKTSIKQFELCCEIRITIELSLCFANQVWLGICVVIITPSVYSSSVHLPHSIVVQFVLLLNRRCLYFIHIKSVLLIFLKIPPSGSLL